MGSGGGPADPPALAAIVTVLADKAMHGAAHPAMRVVRPPVAAGQSRRPSSDMDDNDNNVDDGGGGGLWQRERQDPVVER